MGFSIEEMQGCIVALGGGGPSFGMIGIKVLATEKTSIMGAEAPDDR